MSKRIGTFDWRIAQNEVGNNGNISLVNPSSVSELSYLTVSSTKRSTQQHEYSKAGATCRGSDDMRRMLILLQRSCRLAP